MKNAIEAMPNGGKLIIKVKQAGEQLLLRFTDEGVGMSAEEISMLGYPFYTTKETGTGLGLMMCYRIIEAHNGTLEVKSEKGAGTTYRYMVKS